MTDKGGQFNKNKDYIIRLRGYHMRMNLLKENLYKADNQDDAQRTINEMGDLAVKMKALRKELIKEWKTYVWNVRSEPGRWTLS